MKVTIDTSGMSFALGVVEGFSKTASDKKFISSFLGYAHASLDSRFSATVDAAAIASPATLHHVYEWGKAGVPGGRLWEVVLTGTAQNKVATVVWLPSNKPVPVDPALTTPGPTGKSVKENVHIFYWKAPIMESGLDVTIYPKHSEHKTLAFIDSEGNLRFSKKPVTLNPGGGRTTGSFTKIYQAFWNVTAPEIIDSEIKPYIQRKMTAAGVLAVRQGRRVFNIKSDPYAYHAGENLGQKELQALAVDIDLEVMRKRLLN